MRSAAFMAAYILSCLVACVVVRGQPDSAAQRLIDDTETANVQHLDLLLQPYAPPTATPWFGGCGGGDVAAEGVAVATIGHPLRRMLLHLRREGVELKEGMSWAERGGHAADARSSYRQGYQVVDNYFVRVLAGKSAWDLPPGRVGNDELQAARIALGKFEVILRADCLAVDLPLLQPYLARPVAAASLAEAARETEELLASGGAHYLVFGKEGHQLLRDNRWDLQLWDFALKLVESRSTSKQSYLCGSATAARSQRMPGEGKRAVVYNTPSFHITGVAMFSCVLMSLGFDVTAVIKDPGAGYYHLLPCPNTVVTLIGHYLPDVPGEVLDQDTAAALGLSPGMTPDQQQRQQRQQLYYEEYQRVKKLEEEEEERQEELRQKQELEQQELEQQQGQGEQEQEEREEEEPRMEGGGRKTKHRRNMRRDLLSAPGGGGTGRGGLRTRQDEPQGTPNTGAEDSGFKGAETSVEETRYGDGARKLWQQEERRGHEPRTFHQEDGRLRGMQTGGRRGASEWKKTGGGVSDRDKQIPPAENHVEAGEKSVEDIEGVAQWGGQNQLLGGDEDDPSRTFENRVWDVEQEGVNLSWGLEGEAAPRQEQNRQRRHLQQREEEEGSRASESVSLTGSLARAEEDAGGGRRTEREGKGPFDLSVLCTVISDVNHLMKARYPVDPRLVDALLWDVDVSIWNLHSVEGAFRNEHRMPPAVEDFVRGVPSMEERGGGGRTPPLTFLTLYGEHVEQWDRWSEEAYEGWGWDDAHPPNSHGVNASIESPVPPELAAEVAAAAAAAASEGASGDDDDEEDLGYGYAERGNSTFGAIFRRPGVVYPIHPTGHLRLPRPKRPFAGLAESVGEGEGEEEEDKKKEEVIFVVQGNMQSTRRDYPELTRCLEAMCSTGRENYQLVAVGARGDLPDEIKSRECVEKRTTEWRHLEYPAFYGNISAGHFVVTAAAGHDYEYDKATSTVPTALLLERPLVMSSTLLDAYPCLRKSRVHSMVANDDLCLTLQAAYDLSTDEYDEMELEARDCKLEMWHRARETVAGMASGWTLG